MSCDRLYMTDFSFWTNAPQPTIGIPISLQGIVFNHGKLGDCPRSGNVHFFWRPLSTSGAQAEVARGTVFSVKNGDILIPATEKGVAQASWTPTNLQVGQPPASGHLVASVDCIGSACTGSTNPPFCAAVGIDPGSDYTIVSDLVTFVA